MERPPPPNTTSPHLTGDEEEEEQPSRAAAGLADRLKRDEWSEGAVSSLLDAYEAKWALRNRVKLKGRDWEDVARQVSSRADSTKPTKTMTQCKNKIESMKKRYRSESASSGGNASKWPHFLRLDVLVRCRSAPPPPPPLPPPPPPLMLLAQQSQPSPSGTARHSLDINGIGVAAEGEEGLGVKLGNQQLDRFPVEMDRSTHECDAAKETLRMKGKKKRREKENWEVLESIHFLAEVVMRVEQSRTDMMTELERMRAETDARKGEMDLKRTEIVAKTQLKIAKLLVKEHEVCDSLMSIPRG